jgi:MFS family permease
VGRLRLLRRFAVDLAPIRSSRHFRNLEVGLIITSLGSQAALVALPFQIYVVSHSATLVGLLGAFELGPMIVVSLVGGAFLDRHDRRPILIGAQLLLIVVLGALAALSLAVHRPPVLALLVLGGLLAGCSSLDQTAYSSIIPGVLGPDLLRSGIAFSYGMFQATSIVGPGVGGLLIAGIGVGGVYAINAVTSMAMLVTAWRLPAQPPTAIGSHSPEHPPIRRAIADGLSFVARTRALAGSFLVDINAMTFGMPRALFAVLALTVYHAGAGGTGLLYAAIAVGGTISVLTSGWIQQVRRLGRVVLACVALWGLAILAAGLVRSIWPAAILLAAAGWADGISAVGRTTISQTLTPEHMRGRMSSVFSLVVTGGVRLGDMESGFMAGLFGALNSVVIGGGACILGVGAVMAIYPELAAYDADEAMTMMRTEHPVVEIA